MNKESKHIILSSILILVLFFQLGQSCFFHYHKNKDGTITKHAHPYKQKENQNNNIPFAGHQHSRGELICIELLDGLFPHHWESVHIEQLVPLVLETTLTHSYKISLSTNYQYLLHYRGPPSETI